MSDTQTNAMLNALEAQRNAAMNDVVRLTGSLNVALATVKELETENKALKDKYEPKTQEKTDAPGPDISSDK